MSSSDLAITNALDNSNSDTTSINGVSRNTITSPETSSFEQMQVVEPPSDPEIEYPTGLKFASILMAACLSLIMVGLDNNIIATAVPTITNEFHTIADVGWYSSVYRIMACSSQFLFGKLYTVLSLKPVFLAALITFELGSLVAGIAPSSPVLVLGRAISGLGAAGIFAGLFAMITVTVPLRHRALLGGTAATVESLAAMSAPVLGGVITDKISWRWCFYINLPVGGITFIAVALFFQDPRKNLPSESLTVKQKIARLDLLGTAIFVPAIACLLLALQWGGNKYGWTNVRIIMLFMLFLLLLAVFAWLQYRKGDAATLPLRIIAQRSILSGMWFSACNNATLSVVEYYMPIYFQAVKGASPTKSGILTLPSIIGGAVSMLIGGSGTSIMGQYAPFMLITSILTPVAAGLLTTLRVDASLATLISYQALLGFGVGIGFQAPQVAAQTILPQRDVQIGIALILFAQNLGPAVFVSVAQSIFTARLTSDLSETAPRLVPAQLEHMGLSDIRAHLGSKNLAAALRGYDLAVTQTFYLVVALTCLTMAGSSAIEWRSVKKKKQ